MARRNKQRPVAAANGGSRVAVWLFAIASVLALLGLADAVYLTAEHLAGANVSCGESTGCQDVLGSRYATIGKVPLAGLGALAYFAAFAAATLAAFGYRRARIALSTVVGVMFLATLWLLYVQAFILHAFCRYCLLSASLTLCLTGIIIAAPSFSRPE